VYRQKTWIQKTQFREAGKGTPTILSETFFHLMGGFMDMHVDGQLLGFGQFPGTP
jgi:hypothetical protein